MQMRCSMRGDGRTENARGTRRLPAMFIVTVATVVLAGYGLVRYAKGSGCLLPTYITLILNWITFVACRCNIPLCLYYIVAAIVTVTLSHRRPIKVMVHLG